MRNWRPFGVVLALAFLGDAVVVAPAMAAAPGDGVAPPVVEPVKGAVESWPKPTAGSVGPAKDPGAPPTVAPSEGLPTSKAPDALATAPANAGNVPEFESSTQQLVFASQSVAPEADDAEAAASTEATDSTEPVQSVAGSAPVERVDESVEPASPPPQAQRVPGTPLVVGPVDAAAGSEVAKQDVRTPDAVDVQLLGSGEAGKVGIGLFGFVLTDAGQVTREDQSSLPAVHVEIDYSSFEYAFGGDFGGRLQIVRYPSCVLTTPEKAECSKGDVVEVSNDTDAAVLSADLLVDEAEGGTFGARRSGSGGSAYGISAGYSSNLGSFNATPLAAAGSWSVSEGMGGFNYTYPVPVPPSGFGAAPSVCKENAAANAVLAAAEDARLDQVELNLQYGLNAEKVWGVANAVTPPRDMMACTHEDACNFLISFAAGGGPAIQELDHQCSDEQCDFVSLTLGGFENEWYHVGAGYKTPSTAGLVMTMCGIFEPCTLPSTIWSLRDLSDTSTEKVTLWNQIDVIGTTWTKTKDGSAKPGTTIVMSIPVLMQEDDTGHLGNVPPIGNLGVIGFGGLGDLVNGA